LTLKPGKAMHSQHTEKARRFAVLRRFFVCFFVVYLLLMPRSAPSLAQQQSESPAAMIAGTGIHLVEDQGADTAALVIDLTDEAAFRHEVLANPPRIAIDLERVVFSGPGTRPSSRAVGPVAGYRAGLFLTGQSRIVIDLARPAIIERGDFVRQGRAVRLVLQIRGVNAERFGQQAARDSEERRKRRSDAPVIAGPPRADGKPVVVIDPGHGGIDPGASGLRGEAEKDIVLAFGRVLRDQLLVSGRVAVEMTRDDDRFISLRERVDFARAKGAALFISLHADVLSGEPEVRGASVYTLSERASDAAAARAAEKENRADLAAGLDPDDEARGGVESVLFDLAKRETRAFSQIAARDAVGAIREGFRLHKTPLRGAGFRVLRAPDLPSVLIELGYLSNAEDLAALTDPSARQRLAVSLGAAIERFVLAERVTRPAPQ
jgi:N-acetylmuramoyl-L-alanine amidase